MTTRLRRERRLPIRLRDAVERPAFAVRAAVRTHPLSVLSVVLSVLGLLALEGSAAFEPRWALGLGVAAFISALADTRARHPDRLEFATAVAISASATLIAAAGLVVVAEYGCRVCD